MMESERSHRSGSSSSSTSEFFLCFSSRSSSSMKISSKSILSPGRNREPSVSLSSSLSRRLRSNGSMKGGQSSPMFPTGSKKKGSSFEPPEPSSPKVTCIGQVRVKSKKKHGRKLRTRSQRRGEVSFRKTEQTQDGIHHQQPQQECLPHRNQRWVHLPLSICETIRAFGSEINCFLPCGGRSSSCSWTSEREKVEKRRGTTTATSSGSCGAVFARWLFALQESEEKGREINSVAREEEEEEKREERERVHEMEVEMEMEMSEEKLEEKGETKIVEEEEGRVSICIPPKNALLLMRCRSAPFRMSSLANRFWDSPAPKDDNGEKEQEELAQEQQDEEEENEKAVIEEEEEEQVAVITVEEEKEEEDREEIKEGEMLLKCVSAAETFEEFENRLKEETSEDQDNEEEKKEQVNAANEEEKQKPHHEEDVIVNGFSVKSLENEENLEKEEIKIETKLLQEEEVKAVVKEERRVSFSTSTLFFEPEEEEETESALEQRVEKSAEVSEEETEQEEETEINGQDEEDQEEEKSKERETEEDQDVLPECLLLMMCEPKLSMEVSKETWVCSTDFIRFRHSEKKVIQTNGGDESKKRLSTDSKPTHPSHQKHQKQKQQQKHIQPPRSSCSKIEPIAAPPSMAAMIEQKLVNTEAYEPFVLKRCKSEPMRTAAKLAPEVCFWKNNKLEPHRPPSLGVGATGIGF